MDKLKLCPFCGKEPVFNVIANDGFIISCPDDKCCVICCSTPGSVIKSWNTSPEPRKVGIDWDLMDSMLTGPQFGLSIDEIISITEFLKSHESSLIIEREI